MDLYKSRIGYSNYEYFQNISCYIDSYRHYVEQIDKLINKEIRLSEERLNDFRKKNGENPIFPDPTILKEYSHRQRTLLRNIYYDSLIITMYSFVEKQLNFVCGKVESKHDIKLSDISGKGVFKYKKYLEKVNGVSFEVVKDEWSELMKFNLIRNFIVHSESFRIFPKSKIDLYNSLSSFESIEIISVPDEQLGFNFLDNRILFYFSDIVSVIMNHVFYEKMSQPGS